ncbi:MAG: DUF3024 domain-containing protein [Gammaproteobacteria bacterium]
MSFSEFEIKRYNKLAGDYVESRRPPSHVRPQLDLGYRLKGQSVEIFEKRPRWDNPQEEIEEAVAKATYVKRQNLWKVYCQRQDLKWHRYDPVPEVQTFDEFLALVEDDRFGCFFG